MESKVSCTKKQIGCQWAVHSVTKPYPGAIWLKTWSQLIQENKHRLQFLREKLDLNIAGEDAFIYLKKTYAEYTRGL
ncbi:MAG TPA: hypothetical protein VK186_25240 [Candidatus Deferrimicrobium sp.]|nr:hypothetical protein [Candidatus Deferrimicrobium sp.]